MTFRSSVVAVGLAGLVASACLFGENAFGQRRELSRARAAPVQDEDKKDKDKKARLDVIYYGVSSCNNKGCHGGEPPKTWIKDENGKKLDLITRGNEAAIFEEHDKHGDAYNVLNGRLGKLMAKNLGYSVTDPKGQGAACLACHAVVVTDEKILKASKAIGYDVADGVGCAACHGAHPEWVAAHALMVTAVKFRPLSAKQKEEQYGLIDLRDPVRRTELCASCHVGNLKEKKFVTHEMYAAGHPPLPGFEVATFSNEEPAHWQLLRDKSPALQKELGLRKGEQEETLLMLLGGVVAFRDTMTLLREQATKAIEKDDKLDLSNYDCYACHHDLKKQTWRQNVEWIKNNRPGKPRLRDWSLQLIRLSAAYLEMKGEESSLSSELEKDLKKLNEAFEVGVGGDLKQIQSAAERLEKLSRGLATKINKNYPTKADLPKILAKIPELYGKKDVLYGYDSAREVAWAAEVVFNELHDRKKADALKGIDAELKLRLPKGRKNTIETYLNENMKAVEKYDPFNFRDALLKNLGGVIAPKKD